MVVSMAMSLEAAVQLERVSDDAKAMDRIAELTKRDLPRDLLRRMVTEDIELLRGRRPDGTYEHATFERMESTRVTDTFTVEPAGDDKLYHADVVGNFIYRVILTSPTRRLLVSKNRHAYVDHFEVEYIPPGGTAAKVETVRVGIWFEPGQNRAYDLKEIAQQVTVRVFGRADKDAGYGNIDVALIQAKVVDNADSPYAAAVASEKAVLRAIDHDDMPSIRALAARIIDQTATSPSSGGHRAESSIDVSAVPTIAGSGSRSPIVSPDVTVELQAIEDLLTGNEMERRQGLDRLHQLLRRLRGR